MAYGPHRISATYVSLVPRSHRRHSSVSSRRRVRLGFWYAALPSPQGGSHCRWDSINPLLGYPDMAGNPPQSSLPPDPFQETTVTESRRKVRRLTRDGILLISGLAGLAWETTQHDAERPFLLMVFAGMIGLPAFIPKNDSDDGHRE